MGRSYTPDLTRIFRDWEYDEDNNVRFITSDDGRELMQIRQPMGIEQYDLNGRPDGVHPEGKDSILDIYLEKEHLAREHGNTLILEEHDFKRLREEGVMFYYRYLALFQVGQYERVIRDTNHNLRIIRLLIDYYPGNDRYELLQYHPYIRRMNAISKAMFWLSEDDSVRAIEELQAGKADIEVLPPVPTPIFEFEKIRSLQHLTQVVSQVRETEKNQLNPGGFKDKLAEELTKAVEAEDYERAATIRDKIKRLDQ